MRQGATDRSSFLGRALVAGGALALGGLAGARGDATAAAPSEQQDLRILNFLLTLEYAQQALYAEALSEGAVTGELRRFAEVAGDHEDEHIDALRALLGARAEPKPTFRFADAVRDAERFKAAALTLEESAAAGYIGQAANLTRRRIQDVARIVPVEARHAAWIRAIVGRNPAPSAADPARTPRQVMRTLERRGFVDGS
ncbi:MAG: ferritin-like domain-containing protein [Actinomycetota bacterium]|nr:ferritin-like domain-containing protein [Actinomycetota bacterium]